MPVLPERNGRVEEVYVGIREAVKAGQPLFRLDSSAQRASLQTAKRQTAEVEAATEVAKTELAAADGKIYAAESALRQARAAIRRRNPDAVAAREVERLSVLVEERQVTLNAVLADKETIQAPISMLPPAERASTEAARDEARRWRSTNRSSKPTSTDGRAVQAILLPVQTLVLGGH